MLKIALTGAGGTGKGTLAKKISEDFNIKVLKSRTALIGKILGLQKYNEESLQMNSILQWSVLNAHRAQEEAMDRTFISERCIWDCIPYFIQKNLPLKNEYINTAIEWSKDYDYIFYLPIEFQNTEENKQEESWKERDDDAKKRTDDIILTYCIPEFVKNNINSKTKIMSVHGSISERAAFIGDILSNDNRL